ncbi:unnamed protein product [Penicillium nalgiovense]|nr:unnamed protein product [Penicillium nalgiovense]
MVLAKFSYFAFYLRIFVSREWRILMWICVGCAGAYSTRGMLQTFLICTPLNWNPTLPGHCVSQNVAFSTIGAFNLLTDVIDDNGIADSLCLEIADVYGDYVGVGWNLRIGYLYRSISIIRIRVITTVDFTDLSYLMIWAAFRSVTEPALAIANSCAPMLWLILKAAFPSLLSSVRAAYSTKPSTKPALSKNSTAKRTHGIDEMDSEFPLTQLDQVPGSADGGSLNDQSQDGRSHYTSYQPPRSVGTTPKGLS